MSKNLKDILKPIVDTKTLSSVADTKVNGITSDSRHLEAGDIFCCVVGNEFDGHDFVDEAIGKGAVAIVAEREVDSHTVTHIKVSNARQALALLACEFYNHPAKDLCLIGVTGTNGKTTTTSLISQISNQPAHPLGTLTKEFDLTTPTAPKLQAVLSELVEKRIEVVAMEVSSHAISQDRTGGIDFSAAVFLNLSQDHLDYHQDMDDYFATKSKLFESTNLSVVNVDTSWGKKLYKKLAKHKNTISFSIDDVDIVDMDLLGCKFIWKNKQVNLAIPGKHNIVNALAALVTLEALGQDVDSCIEALAKVTPIRGRLEVITQEPFAVVVDYAHTPVALETTLEFLRTICSKSLIVVFGCGGERDIQKRHEMGAVSEKFADKIILTSDNSRGEETTGIITDILTGISDKASSKVEVIQDRHQAISAAVTSAQPGDVVLVAGKGHEDTQTIGSDTFSFDDAKILKTLLADMGSKP